MKNKISFCISCKNRSFQKVYWDGKFRNEYFENIPKGSYTLTLLPICLQSIYDSQIDDVEFEVILSDFSSQDTNYDEWVGKTLKKIPIKIIDLGSLFSRGKGLNAAAEVSTGNILFFLDADMIVSSELMKQAIQVLKDYDVFFPICRSYKDPLHLNSWVRDSGYGNLIIWKESFKKFGPWLEREVYGWEDDDMWARLKDYAYREVGIGFYHQWHPVSETQGSFGGQFSREHYRYDLPSNKKNTLFYRLNEKAKNNPLISVLVYLNSDDRDIDKIIRNIQNQTYKNYEIILLVEEQSVIDFIREEYPNAIVVRLDKMNPSYAYNAGIKKSNGDYVVFLKSTDALLPHALETHLQYFITYPECALITGSYSRENNARDITGTKENIKDRYIKLLHFNHIGPLCSAMFNREIFDYVGLFDETLNIFSDYDMYLRIAKDYALFHHEKRTIDDWKSDANKSIKFETALHDICQVYEKHKTSNAKKKNRRFIGCIKNQLKRIYNIIFNNKRYALYEYEVRRAVRWGSRHYKNEYAMSEIMKIRRDNNGQLLTLRTMKTLLFLMRHNPVVLSKLLSKRDREVYATEKINKSNK